jgi:thiamine biosynthesis lipoprotein
MRRKKVVAVLSALLALIVVSLVLLWALYGRHALSYECTNYAMGTYIQQTVYGRNREAAAAAAAKSIGELEDLISWRIEDSDVSKLNAAAGPDWTKIDPRTLSVLKTSLDVARKSGGAFEPTILPITSLWDFGGDNQHVPSKQEIAEFLPHVNYKDLRVDESSSSASLKNHYMAIDLGGIGKGAACDEAVAAYRKAGADSAIIAVGGSVGVYGTKADRTPWHIAVRDPKSSDQNAAAMGQIDLSEGFVSTSGTYEKQFTENGVTYHHLLDPKTGYPENNGLVSVTVTAKSGALSDALSTACFILGREKGEALLKEYGAGGVFIDGSGKVYVTENLKSSFEITNSRYVPAQ